jgi:hypothetical protein
VEIPIERFEYDLVKKCAEGDKEACGEIEEIHLRWRNLDQRRQYLAYQADKCFEEYCQIEEPEVSITSEPLKKRKSL